MRLIAAGFLLVGAAALASLAAPAVSKKGTAAAPKSAGAIKRGAPAAAAAAGKRTVGKRIVRRRAIDQRPTYVGQQRPAPERIQEIERALIEKGYLTGEPDVNWDQATTDALRRFQQSQNLYADGRLSSMSLIALGLGARQNRVAGAPAAVAPVITPDPAVRPGGSGSEAPPVAPLVPAAPPPASSAPLPLPVSLPARVAPLPAPPLPVIAAAAVAVAARPAVVVAPVALLAAPPAATAQAPPIPAGVNKPPAAAPPPKNRPLVVPDTSVPVEATPPQPASN